MFKEVIFNFHITYLLRPHIFFCILPVNSLSQKQLKEIWTEMAVISHKTHNLDTGTEFLKGFIGSVGTTITPKPR